MSEDPNGRLLLRTWSHSGHRYNPKDLGEHVVHLRETKPHALSHTHGLEEAEALRLDLARIERVIGQDLTDRERAVHDLQLVATWRVRMDVFTTAEVERHRFRTDPDVLKIERANVGDRWNVTRRYEDRLTQLEIADRLSDIENRVVTPRQVRTAIESKNRKLRGSR